MIIKPKIRGYICTTAHPVGCAQNIQEQIDFVKSQPLISGGAKKVLVVGASTGYGLASRIVSAFGRQAATVGVFFEKEAEGKKTATAGLYNSIAFEKVAKNEGLYVRSFNGDAFSDEIKKQVVQAIKKDLGQVDFIIYSLAAPRRIHPKTGQVTKSILKPKGKSYTNISLNFGKDELETVTLEPATEDEINQTVTVMGGEDWEMWINALEQENCLAQGVMTVAYSYFGPKLTQDIYRNGTIGAAKDHLEATARKLSVRLKKFEGQALISINKALVTQSSSAIPFIPLYFTILSKVMKEKGVYENCIQQIYRLFSECLYNRREIPVDKEGRIRIDNIEMREDIQAEVIKRWSKINNENIKELADIQGLHSEFLKMFGFGLSQVDYETDVETNLKFE